MKDKKWKTRPKHSCEKHSNTILLPVINPIQGKLDELNRNDITNKIHNNISNKNTFG